MVSPKYARVQSAIVDLIAKQNIGEGQMLPTEKQLAEQFNVSLITIRRAVKHLEENKIVKREQGRGTFVISEIRGKIQNGTIAILNVIKTELNSLVISPQVSDMDDELTKRGWKMSFLVAGCVPDSETVDRLKDVKGVIATGWLNPEWVSLLNALDIPVVFLGGITCDPMNIPMVSFDYKKMAEMLALSLFEKGAGKIGMILGGSDYAPSKLMRDGMVSVLKKRGEKLNPSLVFYSDDVRPGAAIRNVGKFLKEHADADGFLVESQAYIPVMINLYDTARRPFMGIMSVKPRFGSACRNTCEAFFKEDIYERAVEVIIGRIHSGDRTPLNVVLEPCLPE